jgi:hypothetical protein
VGLGLLVVYFLACFHFTYAKGAPSWIWLGSWHMFTHKSTGASRIDAEAEVDGSWRPIDLDALFPTRWESGPRFALSASSKSRMNVVAASACLRHPDHPARVRFTLVRWTSTPGQAGPPEDVRPERLAEWTCGTPIRLPAGRLL